MLHNKNSIAIRIALFLMFFVVQNGYTQTVPTTNLPHFFDSQERLSHPNLGTVTRLRFLTTVDFPPFNFIDQTGRLSGYNIDLLRAICAELKLENVCQVEAVPWDELIPHFKDNGGEAIIAGLNETPTTTKDLIFTQSYLRFPARFVSSENINLTDPVTDSLRRLKIGIVKNTLHEKIFAAYFPDVKWQAFENEDALLNAVKNKTIDLAFGDGMGFAQWLNNPVSESCCHFVGGAYLAPEFLHNGMRIAVAKDNPQLKTALNYALKSLERKGKLTELYLRYFPIGFY